MIDVEKTWKGLAPTSPDITAMVREAIALALEDAARDTGACEGHVSAAWLKRLAARYREGGKP